MHPRPCCLGGERTRLAQQRYTGLSYLLRTYLLSGLRSRASLQEHQGGVLLQLGEQLQGHMVIGFEKGGQLIDQPSLTLDQAILVARESFQLVNECTVGFEPPQNSKVTSCF
jgi:hypothetical protein